MENSAGAGGTIGRSVEELDGDLRPARRPPAARRLPRLVPPLRVGHRRDRPRTRSTRCSTRSTARSGSTGSARCTSTTRRRRSARTATGTRTCSRARWASSSASSSPTRPCRSCPPCSRRPARTATGRSAEDVQVLATSTRAGSRRRSGLPLRVRRQAREDAEARPVERELEELGVDAAELGALRLVAARHLRLGTSAAAPAPPSPRRSRRAAARPAEHRQVDLDASRPSACSRCTVRPNSS